MGNFTFESILISFIVTWGIGLLPPTLIRYVFLKRPVGNWAAIGICGLFYFFSFLVYSAISGSSRGHGALFLVAMVSYWILRKDSPIQRGGVGTDVSPSHQNTASQPKPAPASISAIPVLANVTMTSNPDSSQPTNIRSPSPSDDDSVATQHHVSVPPEERPIEPPDIEDHAYAQVGEELESGNTDKGIWTKAFAQTAGDDKQTRVLYIQLRVAKLMALEEENEKIRSAERELARAEQQAISAERERLGKMSLKHKLQTGIISSEEAEREAYGKTTTFLLAIRNGQNDLVERMVRETPYLLAIRNSRGDTGLHIATREMKIDMIKYLVENGAFVGARNNDGETSGDIARFQNVQSLISVFEEIESQQPAGADPE